MVSKRTVKRIYAGWKTIITYYQYDVFKSVRFFQLWIKCIKHTHASVEYLLQLYTLTESVCKENITGHIVECGAWRGGSSAIMLYRERQLRNKSNIYIFDSFEGFPEPKSIEIDGLKAQKIKTGELSWLKADVNDVILLLKRLKIYDNRVHIVKGWFDQTVIQASIDKISLLNIDADLYESNKVVLENLYHHVEKGGFVVNNDYGDIWIGAKKATDEFLTKQPVTPKLVKIKKGGIYLRKP